MRINTGSPFQSFIFDDDETEKALAVNAYFYAFLQNKIAAYAEQVLDFEHDPMNPAKSITEHECLKACVRVLQELLGEVTAPVAATAESHVE